MSGPIVRKYGFPNFEKIFGERELKHGAEPDSSKTESATTPIETPQTTPASEPASSGSEPPKTPVE